MFGKSPKMPQAPSYIPPPAYTPPAPFIRTDASQSNLNGYIPQVPSAGEITAGALGVPNTGSPERNLLEYGPWMSLQSSPLSPENMRSAEDYYTRTQVSPILAQQQADLQAQGQGSGSYAGALQGQTAAMGNLNAFQAGLNQNQLEFQNKLAARQALYGQPIGLQQQQESDRINRAFGIAQQAQSQDQQQNAYNLGSNQNMNNYGLNANQNHNQFNEGNYHNQLGGYQIAMQNATNRNLNGMNLIGGAFKQFGGPAARFGGDIASGLWQGARGAYGAGGGLGSPLGFGNDLSVNNPALNTGLGSPLGFGGGGIF